MVYIMTKNYNSMRLWLILLVIITGLFAVNITFAQTDTDGDGFYDNVDECPNVRGTARGCPDEDGDGFHDREDECPNQAGTARGCPDSDGDGRADVVDECPNIAGTVRGCPDLDGDGFHMLEDECPNEFGTARGCPDADGDGRGDIVDDCPNTPGNLRGCPDSDGDGFHDREDECPNIAGTVRGCIDSDGDGRPDVADDCPTVAGTIRGCPPTNTPSATTPPSQNNTQNQQTPLPLSTPTPNATTANRVCELIPASDDVILIYQSPSFDADVVGLFEADSEHVLYGVKSPDSWYWLDLGWVKAELVSQTGDCGQLVVFDVPILQPETQTIINIANIDIPRAQIACSYVVELGDTFCFYQMPVPNDDARTMICILQANILNCEAGVGLLFALLANHFGNELSSDDATTNEPIQCAELMLEFLNPAIENEPMLVRLVENYVVGFINPADFEYFAPRPCVNKVEFVNPIIANGEIQLDFVVQPIAMQYEAWQPFGGDDTSVYAGGVPVVALFSPEAQKLLAKNDTFATTPIRIDFLNKFILFGDGSVFFGYNTVDFDELVQTLTGLDFNLLD